MRLYVRCHTGRCQARILISSPANVRSELPHAFELLCPSCRREDVYYNYEVFAEVDPPKAPLGAIVGGLLGAIVLGPVGALGGAVIFGGAAANADNLDKRAVERFNSSV